MVIKIYNSKIFQVLFHILIWTTVIFLPSYFFKPPFEERSFYQIIPLGSLAFNLLLILLFYLNAFIFIPIYFNKKNWITYVIIVLVSISFIMIISRLIDNFTSPPGFFIRRKPVEMNFFPCLLVLAISTVYGVIIKYEKQRKEKETENLKTELQFLRSQINPHFLFNTLNNLVSLARKKSELIEPSLLKLAGLMQYMFYEPDGDKVNISMEITYLKNYIELQKLRVGEDFKIEYHFDEEKLTGIEIAPMILIPFVENAFKHGVVLIPEPEINIQMSIVNKVLQFNVKNKFKQEEEEVKDKSSGIGLGNVRRRLNILYPEKHNLYIFKESYWHIVNLTINLK